MGASGLAVGLVGLVLATPAAAAGGWGPPHAPGAAPAADGRVAADAFGNVVAVWAQGDRLMSARRPPGGRFAKPTTVAAGLRAEEADPALVLSPRGEVAIAWTDPALRVHVRWGRLGGRLGAPQVIGDGVLPQLAADGHGALLVTWKSPPGSAPSSVEVAQRPLGRRFGGRQTLGTTRGRPDLEANLAGHAALLWPPEDAAGSWLALRSPQGRWGAAERVRFDEPSLTAAGIGLDRAGTVFVAASSYQPGPPFRSALLRREPSGAYRPQESFEDDGVIRDFAVEPSGAAAFVLGRPAGGRREVDLFARVRDPAGVLGPSRFLHDRANVTAMTAGPRGGVLAVLATPGAVKVAEHGGDGTFGAPFTLAEGAVGGGTAVLAASGAAAVGWYDGDPAAARWTVAARDAPLGLAAAAAAHAEVLGPTLAPVADFGRVPRLPRGARVARLPLTCSESCDVVATIGAGRRRTRVVRRAAPGRRVVLRVPLARALRGRRPLRYRLRVSGYSRRVATRRGTLRVARRR